MSAKAKVTYTVTLLNGEAVTFTSTQTLAWAVVTVDRNGAGMYARSANRAAADRKAAEARTIEGDYAYSRVEVAPITVVD